MRSSMSRTSVIARMPRDPYSTARQCAIFVVFSIFLLDFAGHSATRRWPDLAREPEFVHHWGRPYKGAKITGSKQIHIQTVLKLYILVQVRSVDDRILPHAHLPRLQTPDALMC